MQLAWCHVCCTQHSTRASCPGELRTTEPERQGWRVNVETPLGIEAYGVLLAPSDECWRARILTYPNVLWLVPNGYGTLKFAASTEKRVERKAIEFIRQHCHDRGYRMRIELAEFQPATVRPPALAAERHAPQCVATPSGPPAPRKVRFLPLRYGVVAPSEPAGTGNLSETGMFILTESPLDSGAHLSMLLKAEDEKIPLTGSVRWAREQHTVGLSPGMGVVLDAPPEQYVNYVRSLE